jgi:hypothetical protein
MRVVNYNFLSLSERKITWATWVLCFQKFGSVVHDECIYDIISNKVTRHLQNKIENFTKQLFSRL